MIRSLTVLAISGALLSACGGNFQSTPRAFGGQPPALAAGAANPYAVVMQFFGDAHGQYPYGGVLVTNARSAVQTLYGTTETGGLGKACNYFCGTVWTAQSDGKSIVPIYDFKGALDGQEPLGNPVTDTKGALYGTTSSGGRKYPPWYGLIYKLTLAKKKWTKTNVHIFSGSDGSGPQQLLLTGNELFGTSANGVEAANCCGNVFEVRTDGSGFHVIHTFTSGAASKGETPAFGPLAYDPRTGALYGETRFGGHFDSFACQQGCGVLYKLTPQGTGYAYSVLHTFAYLDDGTTATLYGDAASGGIHNCGVSLPVGCGTVFSYADPGGFSTIYEFKGAQVQYSDAIQPQNGVVYLSGHLYGTADAGGTPLPSGQVFGAIFDVDIASKSDVVLHTFSGYPHDGAMPQGGLTLAKTARGTVLYGTTFEGGSSKTCPGGSASPTGCGTLWRYVPH